MKRALVHRANYFHLLFAAFFLVYFLVGIHVYSNYGVSIDEYSQIDLGRVNYERIFSGSTEIQSHYDRYYGPAFEVPLYIFSRVVAPMFGIGEMDARHLGVFLFFASSLIYFYRFLSVMNRSSAYGFLGVLLLAMTPRFFAEGFFNSKDIVFLSATIFVLWAYIRVQKQTAASLIRLGLITGFAVAVRAQGLLIMLVITIAMLADGSSSILARCRLAVWYIVVSLVATYGMFPVFWNDTIRNIIGFWNASANPVGVPTFYFGSSYISPNLPWHYHVVWVSITGLLSVCIFSSIGIFWYSATRLKRSPDLNDRAYLGMLLIIFGTFIVSVFFHPRSYDGWRHIYYIYPSMIAFAVYVVRRCFDSGRRSAAIAVIVVFVLDMFFAVRFMLRNHPNQYVYFNPLAGGYPHAKANFDFDYWGISYKQILQYLLSMPISRPTTVYFQQTFPYTEQEMVVKLHQKGISVTTFVDEADVYVTIDRDSKEFPPPSFRKHFAVTVEGADLSAVYIRDSRSE